MIGPELLAQARLDTSHRKKEPVFGACRFFARFSTRSPRKYKDYEI